VLAINTETKLVVVIYT